MNEQEIRLSCLRMAKEILPEGSDSAAVITEAEKLYKWVNN